MSNGRSILNSHHIAVIRDDPDKLSHLIDNAIGEAFRKGFMSGYNQSESLVNPEGEAEKLAYHHICNDAPN